MRSLPHADAILQDENPVCIFNAADTLGYYNNVVKAQLCHRLGLDDEGVYLTLKALMEEK